MRWCGLTQPDAMRYDKTTGPAHGLERRAPSRPVQLPQQAEAVLGAPMLDLAAATLRGGGKREGLRRFVVGVSGGALRVETTRGPAQFGRAPFGWTRFGAGRKVWGVSWRQTAPPLQKPDWANIFKRTHAAAELKNKIPSKPETG